MNPNTLRSPWLWGGVASLGLGLHLMRQPRRAAGRRRTEPTIWESRDGRFAFVERGDKIFLLDRAHNRTEEPEFAPNGLGVRWQNRMPLEVSQAALALAKAQRAARGVQRYREEQPWRQAPRAPGGAGWMNHVSGSMTIDQWVDWWFAQNPDLDTGVNNMAPRRFRQRIKRLARKQIDQLRVSLAHPKDDMTMLLSGPRDLLEHIQRDMLTWGRGGAMDYDGAPNTADFQGGRLRLWWD